MDQEQQNRLRLIQQSKQAGQNAGVQQNLTPMTGMGSYQPNTGLVGQSLQQRPQVGIYDLPEEARPFTMTMNARGQIQPKFNLNTRSGMAYALKAQGLDDNTIARQLGAQDASQLGQMIQEDFANLQSQYNQPNIEQQIKMAQLAKLQRETELMGQPTPASQKEMMEKSKMDEMISTELTDKIYQAEALKKDPGLSGAVGPNALARFAPIDSLTGAKQSFISKAEGLLANETLNQLISAKDRGATFGALSEDELRLLKEAASTINFAKVKDSAGNVTGYSLNEKDFKNALDTLINKSNKFLKAKQGLVKSSLDAKTMAADGDPRNPYQANKPTIRPEIQTGQPFQGDDGQEYQFID